MLHRRQFLATPLICPLFAAARAQADEVPTPDDGTWLTYAINVEMFWTRLPVLERIKKVKESGFSHYEFWQWRNKDLDAIKKLNDELGLHVTQFSASPPSFDRGIADPARRDEFLADVRAAVDVAKQLKVGKLCVVAGEEPEGLARSEQTRGVIEALRGAAPIVEEAGVTLILEPLNVLVDHPKQLVYSSAHAAEILSAVDSPAVKMLFDVYHQQISEGNLTGNIRAYRELIGYFQIADHPGRHEPGTGEINYGHVLRVISESGYRGAIGLELSPKDSAQQALAAVRKADADAKAGSQPNPAVPGR